LNLRTENAIDISASHARKSNVSLYENTNAGPFWAPANGTGTITDGGAGIRTPVREKIDHSVYVRVPLIDVSSRWPMDSPLLDKFPKFSPAAGKRDD